MSSRWTLQASVLAVTAFKLILKLSNWFFKGTEITRGN